MINRSNRKRMVASLALLLAWLGFVIEGGHALFSDRAVLTGNTISTGSVDLKVSNSQTSSPSSYTDETTGFTYTLNPGQLLERYLFLRNTSPTPTGLDLAVSIVPQGTPSAMYKGVNIAFTPVDSLGNATGAPVIAMMDTLINQPHDLAVMLGSGLAQRFKVRLAMGIDYSGQAEQIAYDLQFTGTQHPEPAS